MSMVISGSNDPRSIYVSGPCFVVTLPPMRRGTIARFEEVINQLSGVEDVEERDSELIVMIEEGWDFEETRAVVIAQMRRFIEQHGFTLQIATLQETISPPLCTRCGNNMQREASAWICVNCGNSKVVA